jgi:hypothetical protein
MSNDMERSVLIYHVYLKNNWKDITRKLLKRVPHNDIFVNLNVDWYALWQVPFAIQWLKKNKKVKQVFVTLNSKAKAEVAGFEKLRNAIKGGNYSLATYMHGKGVTKPGNRNIEDWVELMRYFIIDRMDLCTKAFEEGYKLYGVNIGMYDGHNERYGPYKFSDFHFSGNFATVNLLKVGKNFFAIPLDIDYFGVEGFWGKLCDFTEAYCPHISNIANHYQEPYPPILYK